MYAQNVHLHKWRDRRRQVKHQRGNKKLHKQCSVCLEKLKAPRGLQGPDGNGPNIVRYHNCPMSNHIFDIECMAKCILLDLGKARVPRCPTCRSQGLDYKSTPSEQNLRDLADVYLLPDDVVHRFKAIVYATRTKLFRLPKCSQKGCFGMVWCTPTVKWCDICHVTYCMTCEYMTPKHDGVECKTMEEIRLKALCSEKATRQMLKGLRNCRECPRCGVFLEKTDGCDHMTCHCQHEFCYLCMADWNSSEHTYGSTECNQGKTELDGNYISMLENVL